MSELRTVWAYPNGHWGSTKFGWGDFAHLYHHDDVMRELVEAGTALAEHAIFHDREYLSADLIAKLDGLRAALAKIAQEE